ncbi:hypothetical protein [Nocardioides nanhaiensis]
MSSTPGETTRRDDEAHPTSGRDVTVSGQREREAAATEEDSDDGAGQVSEVGTLADAGEPIEPDQAVAGAPDGESGAADEGAAGPNAIPPENREANRA